MTPANDHIGSPHHSHTVKVSIDMPFGWLAARGSIGAKVVVSAAKQVVYGIKLPGGRSGRDKKRGDRYLNQAAWIG